MTTWPKREFTFGPPSNPRRVNFFGHFSRKLAAKRWRINLLHGQALVEDAARSQEGKSHVLPTRE